MRILIVTQYYTPEPSFRPCELAPALAAKGHEVLVLTGYPSYPFGKVYDGYGSWRVTTEISDGVKIVRHPVFADHSRSRAKRLLYYGSIAAGACITAPLLASSFDVAFVYSPPITLAAPALILKAFRQIPFVYDVQDVYPESLAATGMMDSPTILSAVNKASSYVYKRAAAITVISPGFKLNLMKKIVPEQKIHVIPNWANENVYRPVQTDAKRAAELGLSGKFVVMYGGNIGIPQGLSTVIQTANILRAQTNIHFVIVGEGVQKAGLEKEVQKLNLQNVSFLGHRQPSEMAGIFALADVLLIHLRKDPLFAITIPSKTIAYLGCGKPILCAVEGDTAELIRKCNAGYVCPPEDPQTMAETVMRMRAAGRDALEEMGTNSRKLFLENFTKEILVNRIEELLRKVSGEKRG